MINNIISLTVIIITLHFQEQNHVPPRIDILSLSHRIILKFECSFQFGNNVLLNWILRILITNKTVASLGTSHTCCIWIKASVYSYVGQKSLFYKKGVTYILKGWIFPKINVFFCVWYEDIVSICLFMSLDWPLVIPALWRLRQEDD